MQIQFLFEDKGKYFFKISDAAPEEINTLRRIIIEEVPVMAIEEVYIEENNSALYDEQLALRLGLIPLKTDLGYNFRKDCSCGGAGCSLCQVEFNLEAKGPGYIYSKDLKSSDPNVEPVYNKIPINYLTEWQEVKLKAIAILGRGKEHVKWEPAHVYYFELPEIKKDDSGLSLNEKKIAKMGLEKLKRLEEAGKVQLKDSNNWVFVIEPFGQLDVKEILKEAFGIIKEKAEKAKEKIFSQENE